MTKNNTSNIFDFTKPNTFGFTSSWAENFDPEGNYVLTKRRRVNLKEFPARSIMRAGKETSIFLRNEHGTREGLSSGAGSSIVDINGRPIKIKRNGYKENGPVSKPFKTVNKGKTEIVPYRGILSLEQALGEYQAIKKLKEDNLCSAYTPVDILEYTIPGTEKKAYALITEINSDVRIDEVIFGLHGAVLADKVRKKELVFDQKKGLFTLEGLVDEGFNDKTLKEDLYMLGYSLGSFYKEFHEKGWVRGYPHSWFGNEVLNSDGTISFVDLEDATNTFKVNDLKRKQRLEWRQAQGALVAEFEYLGIEPLSCNAAIIAEAFANGYKDSSSSIKLDEQVMQRFKENTFKANKVLWREQI